MAEQQRVKVFISWSGERAKLVAVALRVWLPDLFDVVDPWVSDSDIAAGQRGLSQIESELSGTRFGIVVVTHENISAPWLNFEAGAMSRTIEGDIERRVVPLLLDLDGPSQLTGPLAQFQAKRADREGLADMLASLAQVAGVPEATARRRLDKHWEDLEARLLAIPPATTAQAAEPTAQPENRRSPEEMLDELVDRVRRIDSRLPSATEHFGDDPSFPSAAAVRHQAEAAAAWTKLAIDEVRPDSGGFMIWGSPRGKAEEEDLRKACTVVLKRLHDRFPNIPFKIDYVPF